MIGLDDMYAATQSLKALISFVKSDVPATLSLLGSIKLDAAKEIFEDLG